MAEAEGVKCAVKNCNTRAISKTEFSRYTMWFCDSHSDDAEKLKVEAVIKMEKLWSTLFTTLRNLKVSKKLKSE